MNTLDSILGMIATEAFEDAPIKPSPDLSPIDYKLELIRSPDGSLEWVE